MVLLRWMRAVWVGAAVYRHSQRKYSIRSTESFSVLREDLRFAKPRQ
jgi:hypothetical protein